MLLTTSTTWTGPPQCLLSTGRSEDALQARQHMAQAVKLSHRKQPRALFGLAMVRTQTPSKHNMAVLQRAHVRSTCMNTHHKQATKAVAAASKSASDATNKALLSGACSDLEKCYRYVNGRG